MGFNTTSVLVRTSDGWHNELVSPFSYTTKAGEVIVVPAGAKSDGASIPRGFWNLLPPFGTYWLAAFLHDYLFRITQRPEAECDDIFNEAMESLGVHVVVRHIIIDCVRGFGHIAFTSDRLEQLKDLQPSHPS